MNNCAEIIKREIEGIYTNVLFHQKEQHQNDKVEHNAYVFNAIGSGMWRHVLILTYDGDLIDVKPSIYGPRIELPLSLDLHDPESIEKLCQMLDECGGKRK